MDTSAAGGLAHRPRSWIPRSGAPAVSQNSQQSSIGRAETIRIATSSSQAARVRGCGPPSIQSTTPTTARTSDSPALYLRAIGLLAGADRRGHGAGMIAAPTV
jgi:hypothetical protein